METVLENNAQILTPAGVPTTPALFVDHIAFNVVTPREHPLASAVVGLAFGDRRFAAPSNWNMGPAASVSSPITSLPINNATVPDLVEALKQGGFADDLPASQQPLERIRMARHIQDMVKRSPAPVASETELEDLLPDAAPYLRPVADYTVPAPSPVVTAAPALPKDWEIKTLSDGRLNMNIVAPSAVLADTDAVTRMMRQRMAPLTQLNTPTQNHAWVVPEDQKASYAEKTQRMQDIETTVQNAVEGVAREAASRPWATLGALDAANRQLKADRDVLPEADFNRLRSELLTAAQALQEHNEALPGYDENIARCPFQNFPVLVHQESFLARIFGRKAKGDQRG